MDSLIPSPSHAYCNGICEGCTLYPACPDETDEEEQIKATPDYRIHFNSTADEWIAVEKCLDDGSLMARMEFCGYGKTPEDALKNLQSAHEDLEVALREPIDK